MLGTPPSAAQSLIFSFSWVHSNLERFQVILVKVNSCAGSERRGVDYRAAYMHAHGEVFRKRIAPELQIEQRAGKGMEEVHALRLMKFEQEMICMVVVKRGASGLRGSLAAVPVLPDNSFSTSCHYVS
jgi:hypothetical protein